MRWQSYLVIECEWAHTPNTYYNTKDKNNATPKNGHFAVFHIFTILVTLIILRTAEHCWAFLITAEHCWAFLSIAEYC